jgi:hypothetical protein
MFKLFPGKTPMRIRIGAQQGRRPILTPGTGDPSVYPTLYADGNDADEAASDWLAHLAAGRIQIR